MMLTPEQKLKYIKSGGEDCPYCGGSIEGGSIEIDAGGAYQEISCVDCGRQWEDCYTLTDIAEDTTLTEVEEQ